MMTTRQHMQPGRIPALARSSPYRPILALIVGLCLVVSCTQTGDESGAAVEDPAVDRTTVEALPIESVDSDPGDGASENGPPEATSSGVEGDESGAAVKDPTIDRTTVEALPIESVDSDPGDGASENGPPEATSSGVACVARHNSVTLNSVAQGDGRYAVAIALDGIGFPIGELIANGATIATFPTKHGWQVEPSQGVTVVGQSAGSSEFTVTIEITGSVELSATVEGEVQAAFAHQDGSCAVFWTFTFINSEALHLSP